MAVDPLRVYRSCQLVVAAEYDAADEQTPVECVVEALAEATGTDPLELTPLYQFIDPDTLDQFFRAPTTASRESAFLGFQVETWNVFIRGDGRIRVCDTTEPTTPTPVFESTPE